MPKESMMSYEEMKYFIPSIEDYWTRMLIAVQYATGCRIGELLYYKHCHCKAHEGKITYGLRYERITEHEKYWKLVFPVFKKRKLINEPRYLSKSETWLMNQIDELFKKQDSGYVFEMSISTAKKMIRKVTSQVGFDEGSNVLNKRFSSHNLRATRISHLLNEFGYNLIEAKEAVCLSRIDVLPHYFKSKHEDRLHKIEKMFQE